MAPTDHFRPRTFRYPSGLLLRDLPGVDVLGPRQAYVDGDAEVVQQGRRGDGDRVLPGAVDEAEAVADLADAALVVEVGVEGDPGGGEALGGGAQGARLPSEAAREAIVRSAVPR